MALTPFIQDGHMVFYSDLILALTIHDVPSAAFPSLLSANQSRLHTDPALTDWTPPGHRYSHHPRTPGKPTPTPSPHGGTFLLSFPRPPKDPRGSAFVLGRDPDACDIVLDSPFVSAQHVRFGFAHGSGIVIQDISENGTGLVENGRDVLWSPPRVGGGGGGGRQLTPPRSPEPKTEMLLPGAIYDLQVPGFHLQFHVPSRHGHEEAVYEKKRRAFIDARGITADWSWERS